MVPCSLHFVQLWISRMVSVYCKKQAHLMGCESYTYTWVLGYVLRRHHIVGYDAGLGKVAVVRTSFHVHDVTSNGKLVD